MKDILNKKHFDTILNFSRKITKGCKADDLSQHVILKVLQLDKTKIRALIDRKELDYYLWRVVSMMYFSESSTFNREEYGTRDFNKRINTIDLNDLTNVLQEPTDEDCITIDEVLNKSDLNEIERLIIDYYLEYNGSYTTMGNRLGIDKQTVSIKVREIIDKCKKLK